MNGPTGTLVPDITQRRCTLFTLTTGAGGHTTPNEISGADESLRVVSVSARAMRAGLRDGPLDGRINVLNREGDGARLVKTRTDIEVPIAIRLDGPPVNACLPARDGRRIVCRTIRSFRRIRRLRVLRGLVACPLFDIAGYPPARLEPVVRWRRRPSGLDRALEIGGSSLLVPQQRVDASRDRPNTRIARRRSRRPASIKLAGTRAKQDVTRTSASAI